MPRTLFASAPLCLLAGCISFSSTEPQDYVAYCQDKETYCRQLCGDAGVQAFSCKAAPREGTEYKCECRKPAGKSI